MLIFDLDGTLIETKQLHRDSFKYALSLESSFKMTKEIEDILEGRPSLSKIKYLNETYNLNLNEKNIYRNKQKHTVEHIDEIEFDYELINILDNISHPICLASNARSDFVFKILNKFNLDMFQIVLTANYIPRGLTKPNPFMFLECMRLTGYSPEETIIFEDSKVGIEAATASKARVIKTNPSILIKQLKDLKL